MARVINQFQKQFESLLAYWPDEDQELHQLRSKAFDQFLFTTGDFEKWMIIEKGEVLASGKHDELLNISSQYKSFYEKQIRKG